VVVETNQRRIHAVMPDDLVDAVDRLVGSRRRSEFITDLVASELRRRRFSAALDEMAGSLADVATPG
jgi:metal-responsive CopG/Arc/MetJ family transcriptional regulator